MEPGVKISLTVVQTGFSSLSTPVYILLTPLVQLGDLGQVTLTPLCLFPRVLKWTSWQGQLQEVFFYEDDLITTHKELRATYAHMKPLINVSHY